MISRVDIDERVRLWGLREDVVEKDYVLGWVLWGIGTDPQLSRTWVFKGGTCLKKCYIETYRFSEDLDFTLLKGGSTDSSEVLGAVSAPAGPRQPRVRHRLHGARAGLPASAIRSFGRDAGLLSEGPGTHRRPASIKFDLTKDEVVVRPPVLRLISHDYPDALPAPGQVRCYSFEEVFAEKLRAMGERARPRDLYDIVNLFRRRDFRPHGGLVLDVLRQKCETKGVPVPSTEDIRSSPMFDELEREWGNMLAHQLRALPEFDHFWAEVPRIFAWLHGTEPAEELEPLPLGGDESLWTPPPTFWKSGLGSRLEPVRFAAVNRLLVDLGYDGRRRLIEPYSLRRTSAGHVLLHAVRASDRGSRSYRVDRIQSVRVMTDPFIPRFMVEFPAAGALPAPPSQSRLFSPRPSTSRTKRRRYVVRCSVCGKRFPRVRRSTSLRPHKDPQGWDCMGRVGYLESVV